MIQGDFEKLDMIQFLRAVSVALPGAGVVPTGALILIVATGLASPLPDGSAGFEDKSESTRMLPKPSTAATTQALFSIVCHLSRANTLSTRMMNPNTSSDTAIPSAGIEAKNK